MKKTSRSEWSVRLLVAVASLVLLAACPRSGPKPEPVAEKAVNAGPDLVVDLTADLTCHTQGVTIFDRRLFVSCVERIQRRALIIAYDLGDSYPEQLRPGEPRVVDVTRGAMYHPSGLDHDDRCIWVAVAHYRKYFARSEIICLDPQSLEQVRSFPVPDHIGTVAVMGDRLVLINWDSAMIRLYDQQGHEVFRQANPTGTAYQDCREFSSDRVLCSGPRNVAGRSVARVDLLRFEAGAGLVRESGWDFYDEREGLGREGFYAEPAAGRWYFLPGDFPRARLYRFDDLQITPEAAGL